VSRRSSVHWCSGAALKPRMTSSPSDEQGRPSDDDHESWKRQSRRGWRAGAEGLHSTTGAAAVDCPGRPPAAEDRLRVGEGSRQR
jgi:hypothetical protein